MSERSSLFTMNDTRQSKRDGGVYIMTLFKRVMAAAAALLVLAAGYISIKGIYTTEVQLSTAAAHLSHASDGTLAHGPITVLYPPHQQSEGAAVLAEAQRDYGLETKNLNIRTAYPLLFIVYPNMAGMNVAVGEPAAQNNIGLYYAGTISILSPLAWLPPTHWAAPFAYQSPVGHEMGHALLAAVAHGNYPAWFNEGVAQYEDAQVTGFIWLTRSNALHGRPASQPLYSYAQLTGDFYALPNQSLAYREGLALVQYLVHQHGQSRFDLFIHALGQGGSFSSDLAHYYHVTPSGLYQAWARSLSA